MTIGKLPIVNVRPTFKAGTIRQFQCKHVADPTILLKVERVCTRDGGARWRRLRHVSIWHMHGMPATIIDVTGEDYILLISETLVEVNGRWFNEMTKEFRGDE